MKVALHTLGCRVNTYDTEAMAEMFKKEGYEVVDFNEWADVYVINTCTVTNSGDKKSRQHINQTKKINKDAILCVVGCYAQVASKEISEIEGVDVILGTRNKSRIIEAVNIARKTHEQVIEVTDVLFKPKFEDLNISEFKDKSRAFLKIQDGCNRFCSYCLIPFARGGISSKDKMKVLEEIRTLKENGFKEIILSGIHIASYGHDKENMGDLLDLLEDIETIDGIERVRIGSIEPMFFSGDRMDRISKLKKLCPHFHLSLQSGSNETLKRMNRKYTTEEYEEVVNRIREKIQFANITTDIIVGFPLESEDEFNETYNFLSRIKLTKTHVFKYSPREGTKASMIKEQVDGKIKEERSQKLLKLSEENENTYLESMINHTFNVLVEEKKDGLYRGYTENYCETIIDSKEKLEVGKIVKVKIEKIQNNKLVAFIC